MRLSAGYDEWRSYQEVLACIGFPISKGKMVPVKASLPPRPCRSRPSHSVTRQGCAVGCIPDRGGHGESSSSVDAENEAMPELF